MINKKSGLVFFLILLVCVFFTGCENPIVKKWWVDDKPEPSYVPIKIYVPEAVYETVVDTVYETIYERLPPEVIIQQLPPEVIIEYETVTEYVYETEYKTIYETIIEKEDPEIIIQQLEPETIFEYLTEEQIKYIVQLLPPKVITETVVEYVPEYIYETIYVELPPKVITEIVYETEYVDIITEVEKYITLPPDKETFIEWLENEADPTEIETIKEVILDHYLTVEDIKEIIINIPPEELITYLTDVQIKYFIQHLTEEQIIEIIKNIPSEKIVEYLTDKQIEYILQQLTDEQIKEIISRIPADKIIEYLTDEQIEYIKELIPPVYVIEKYPELFIQCIEILDIEFVIFSGDAKIYNGNSPTAGGTNLTPQERSSNDAIVTGMVNELKNNPDDMLILHGHANPVSGDSDEAAELAEISLARANSVKDELLRLNGSGGPSLEGRITTKGYGGDRNISVAGSTTYSGLNRRVEVILFTIDTTKL